MSNEIERLILPDKLDSAGLRLERNAAGYVHTPWFSYVEPWDFALSQAKYHQVRRAAVEAFAAVLGIDRMDVTITERILPMQSAEREFRLGTRFPVTLPVVATKKIVEPGAIDV
jgi:hypothetical protein